jgi:hypothetical protein
MKHSLAVVAMTTVVMVGCASYQGIYDRDAVRNAALQTVGLEQIAWTSHDAHRTHRCGGRLGHGSGHVLVQRGGQWTQSAPPVEIARNASWKGTA